MSKVWEFFENMNEAVYASDIDTYELIYLNKTARNLFNFKDKAAYKGKKCYEILQQCSSPCAMCTNKRLKPDEFYEWSRFNPMVNRSFLLKDTMVIDDGRRIRIEIAIDLDIQEMTKKTFSQFTDTEALINEGLRCALAEETPEQSINTLLQYLGQMFHSDRVYIFEKNKHGNFDNTFEWCTCGVSPQINMLHNIPPEALGTWPSTFQKGESVIIRNLDDIMSYDPVVYESLMPQNIKRLVTSPISRNQDIIAFYGIDNPPLDRMDHIAFMLQLFGHFIDSMLRRRNLVEKLENLSYYDQLTGAKNRHALNEQLASLTKGQSLGILYGDVMGLKQISDTLGHQAGDKALLYNNQMPFDQAMRGDYHRQRDVKPTLSLNKLINYIAAHDKAKIAIMEDYRKLPKSTAKQRKYYRQAEGKFKRLERKQSQIRLENLFKSIEAQYPSICKLALG